MKTAILASVILFANLWALASPTKDSWSDILVRTLNQHAYKGKTVEVLDCPEEKRTVTHDQTLLFSYNTGQNLLLLEAKTNTTVEILDKQTGKSTSRPFAKNYKATIPLQYLVGLGRIDEFLEDGCTWDGPVETMFSTNCNCIEITHSDGKVVKDQRLTVYINVVAEEGLSKSIDEAITQLRNMAQTGK